MKKNLFIVCIAFLSALAFFACKEKEIDHSGEVHVTTDDVFCDQPDSATAFASAYGDGITDRGVCWGTSEFPTLEDFSLSDGTGGEGSFTLTLTDLTASTLYYVRGYATDSPDKIYYGSSMSFTTTSGSHTPSSFQAAIVEAGLQHGAVRDANTEFVMHYSFDFASDQTSITVTYIESTGDRDAKHVTQPVAFNGDMTQATWTTVSNDGYDFSGITLQGDIFSVAGTSGLTLSKGWTEAQIYSIFTNSSYGGLNRVSELYPDNHHASVSSIFTNPSVLSTSDLEYNGEFSSIVGMPGGYGYLFCQNLFENNQPYIPVTGDVAVFTFGQYLTTQSWMVSDAAQQAEMEAMLQPLTKIWYDTGGLIIVEEMVTGKTLTEGDIFYYAINAQNNGWLKWYLRAQ